MADLHKEINQAQRLGYELRLLVDRFAADVAKLNQLVATMNAMNDGTTQAAIVSRFGLPSGTGADVVYQMNLLKQQLDATVIHEWIDQFEGAIVG